MALIVPTSVNVSGSDALNVTLAQAGSTVIVNSDVSLLTTGTNVTAINVEAGSNGNSILVDGTLGTDGYFAVDLNTSIGPTITIGRTGRSVADDRAIWGNGSITAQFDGIVVSSGGEGTITGGGTLAGPASPDVGVQGSEGLTVTNAGTISGVLGGISASSSTGTASGNGVQAISNTGIITASSGIAINLGGANAASEGLAISETTPSGVGTVVNMGAVTSGMSRGIQVSTEVARIENNGTVTARQIAIFAKGGDKVINTGTLTGEQGIVVNATTNKVTNTVVNAASGVVDAQTFGINLLVSDNGAIVDYNGLVRGGPNSFLFGNIHPTVESALINTGSLIGNVGGAGGVKIINNSGYILGVLDLGSAADIFVDSGTVDGTLRLGNGTDTFRAMQSGSVSGAVEGQAGTDTLIEAAANDTLDGGDGGDHILGHEGADHLEGGGDNDTIDGGAGEDVLEGGSGNDILRGRASEDELAGGLGRDVLTGGADADQFVFRAGGNRGGCEPRPDPRLRTGREQHRCRGSVARRLRIPRHRRFCPFGQPRTKTCGNGQWLDHRAAGRQWRWHGRRGNPCGRCHRPDGGGFRSVKPQT